MTLSYDEYKLFCGHIDGIGYIGQRVSFYENGVQYSELWHRTILLDPDGSLVKVYLRVFDENEYYRSIGMIKPAGTKDVHVHMKGAIERPHDQMELSLFNDTLSVTGLEKMMLRVNEARKQDDQ